MLKSLYLILNFILKKFKNINLYLNNNYKVFKLVKDYRNVREAIPEI